MTTKAPLTPQEKFRLFLVQHDLDDGHRQLVADFAPNLVEEIGAENLVIASTYMASDLTPTQKTIKIPPLIYNAVILSAMKHREGIMEHITNILASATAETVSAEVNHRIRGIMRKLEK